MRTISPPQKVLDSVTSTGNGNKIYVMDYEHLVVTVVTSGSANGTLKFKGSMAETADDVDFSSAQATDNIWDFLQVRDLEDASSLDGDTGLVLSGTDTHRQFKVNVDGINFFTADLESRSAGTWLVTLVGYNNS